MAKINAWVSERWKLPNAFTVNDSEIYFDHIGQSTVDNPVFFAEKANKPIFNFEIN